MKPVISAGLLMYKISQGVPQVLLGHPGGPYYVNRDEGVWSIPKGQAESGESLLETAAREFAEETGLGSPACDLLSLGQVMIGKKHIYIWSFAGNCDVSLLKSNLFSMEWPAKSGIMQEFPEFDRLAFFSLSEARRKIEHSQVAFIDALLYQLKLPDRRAISA
jgi:predicted NUDIX family NTP pyrophosphohydrolase